MNRRNFLKSLLAIPLLKPEIPPSVEDTAEIRELSMVGNGTIYVGGSFTNYPSNGKIAFWNGSSWPDFEISNSQVTLDI